MDIQHQYAPLPASTTAILRQKTLLGEAFVQLSPGAHSGPMVADGGAIPRSHVAPTQQLDQVLGAFGKPTQADLAGVPHRQRGITCRTVSRPQQRDRQSRPGSRRPRGRLRNARWAAGEPGLAGPRHRHRAEHARPANADLPTLITAGDQVLSATASRNTALSATIDALPPFLAQLRSTLAVVNTTLGVAKPSLDALLPLRRCSGRR